MWINLRTGIEKNFLLKTTAIHIILWENIGELVNAQAESRLLSLDPQPDLDNANVGTHGFAEEIGCASYEGAAVFFWHFIRQVAMNRGHHFSSRKKSQHRIMFHSLLFWSVSNLDTGAATLDEGRSAPWSKSMGNFLISLRFRCVNFWKSIIIAPKELRWNGMKKSFPKARMSSAFCGTAMLWKL